MSEYPRYGVDEHGLATATCPHCGNEFGAYSRRLASHAVHDHIRHDHPGIPS